MVLFIINKHNERSSWITKTDWKRSFFKEEEWPEYSFLQGKFSYMLQIFPTIHLFYKHI